MAQKLMEKDGETDPEQLKAVFSQLVQVLKDQGMGPDELLGMYQGEDAKDLSIVPVGIFAGQLSPSEALCKYMRENLALYYKEIADLLKRDERSIWTSCNRAKEKMPGQFDIKDSKVFIPIEIFADRKLSILENLVLYLRENTEETNYGIAKLLNKNPSMIYTIYNRAKAKAAPKSAKKQPSKQKTSHKRRLDIRKYLG